MTYKEQFELLLEIIHSKVVGEENLDISTSNEELLVMTIRNKVLTEVLVEFVEKAGI